MQLLYQIILLIYTGYCEIENYFDIALFLCPHLCVVIVHFTSVHASKSTICSIICITMLLKKLREKGDLVFIYKVCYINLFIYHSMFFLSVPLGSNYCLMSFSYANTILYLLWIIIIIKYIIFIPYYSSIIQPYSYCFTRLFFKLLKKGDEICVYIVLTNSIITFTYPSV